VEVTAGRGTFVTQPPIENVINSMHLILEFEEHSYSDLVVARKILEIPIVRLATQNATEANIKALETYLTNMQSTVDDLDEFIRWDTAFHNELANATQNAVLGILVQPILSMMAATREAVMHVPKMVERAIQFHHDLYLAVKNKDADKAEKVMLGHLNQVAEDNIKALQRGLQQTDKS
jgi:DNA-binding FadR family transcriptional regulator